MLPHRPTRGHNQIIQIILTKNGITNYTPSLELQMRMNNSLNNSQSANEDNNREKENIHVNNARQPNKQKQLIFIHRPHPHSPTNMEVYTLSNRTITKQELNI